jgi:hypothetical protein
MNFVCIEANNLVDMANQLNAFFKENPNGKLLVSPVIHKTWYEALVQG